MIDVLDLGKDVVSDIGKDLEATYRTMRVVNPAFNMAQKGVHKVINITDTTDPWSGTGKRTPFKSRMKDAGRAALTVASIAPGIGAVSSGIKGARAITKTAKAVGRARTFNKAAKTNRAIARAGQTLPGRVFKPTLHTQSYMARGREMKAARNTVIRGELIPQARVAGRNTTAAVAQGSTFAAPRSEKSANAQKKLVKKGFQYVGGIL